MFIFSTCESITQTFSIINNIVFRLTSVTKVKAGKDFINENEKFGLVKLQRMSS